MNDQRAGWKRPGSRRPGARGIQREEANSIRRADRGRSERGRCASLGVDGERRNGANRRLRRICETPGGIERETQRAVFLPQARRALHSQSDVRRRGSPSTATFPTVGRGMRRRMRLGSSWRSPARYSRLLLLNRSPGGSGSRRRRPPWTGLDMRIFASAVCLKLAAGPCSSR
jgi:hypothetical protein